MIVGLLKRLKSLSERTMVKEKTRENMITLGLVFMLAGFLTFAFIFLTAFFSEDKMVMVYINYYNEANVEFVLLIIGLFLGIYSTYEILKEIELTKNKRKNAIQKIMQNM